MAPYREGLFRALDRRGVRFLFVGPDGAPRREILDPGLRRWSAIDARSLGPYRNGVAPALLPRAAGGAYDVWLGSILNWWPTHAAFPLVRGRRKPFALWMEDWWWPDVAFGAAALKRYNEAILTKADAVIAAGTKAREFALAAGTREEKVFVAYNSTESLGERGWDEQELDALRASLAAPHAEFVCLFMNRLVPYKGLDVLLRAWRTVEARDPGAHLAVVGEGPAHAEWEALSEEFGLTRVRFHAPAPHDRVHLLYRASDLYIHPARFLPGERVKAEAWGFTLNEAMSVGTPVLATTAVAAAHDMIEEGVTGRIVPPSNVDALARAILDARGDPRRLADIGQAGRRKVEADFRPEKQAAAFEAAVVCAAGRE